MSWRHPSVKWVHTGSICLQASHGCLFSSQSSLAPSLPTFPFLFMQEHKAVGLSSQGSSRHLLRRPQVLFFPCPNEQGNEKAFLESVKENPFILSSGNNWATIVIRERSDFQGTQWPASSSTTPTTQRQTPRVCRGSRVLKIEMYPLQTLCHLVGTTYRPPNSTGSLLIELSWVEAAWCRMRLWPKHPDFLSLHTREL